VIKSLWERIGREVEKKTYTPRAVVHISANLDPGDIKLWGANESKVKFIASGSIPLKHPRKLKLCDDMEKAARELRSYLPVLLGIGVQCVIPKIVDEQLNAYDGLTKVEDDEREGQILVNYDRVWTAIDIAIDEYKLPKPELFKKGYLDRTALTHYNNLGGNETTEEYANRVVNFLIQTDLVEEQVEFSERSEGFKLKLDQKLIPKEIWMAIKKSTRDMNSTFKGEKLRVKFLSSLILDSTLDFKLKSLLETWDLWTEQLLTEREENLQDYADLFYGDANEEDVNFGGSDPNPIANQSRFFSDPEAGSDDVFDEEEEEYEDESSDEVEASSIKKSVPSDTASTTQGEEVTSPVQKGDRNSKNPAERERTDRLEKRSKRKKEDGSSSSESSSVSKPKQPFLCKKLACPDFGTSFRTKSHLKSKRHTES